MLNDTPEIGESIMFIGGPANGRITAYRPGVLRLNYLQPQENVNWLDESMNPHEPLPIREAEYVPEKIVADGKRVWVARLKTESRFDSMTRILSFFHENAKPEYPATPSPRI